MPAPWRGRVATGEAARLQGVWRFLGDFYTFSQTKRCGRSPSTAPWPFARANRTGTRRHRILRTPWASREFVTLECGNKVRKYAPKPAPFRGASFRASNVHGGIKHELVAIA